jgi:hypothetical protein
VSDTIPHVIGWFASIVAGAALTLLPGFHSPSGNIRCFAVPIVGTGASMLRCEIRRSSYASALQARCMRPDGSGVDWHGFELTQTGKGAVTCSGGILYDTGTQRPSFVDLPYGRTWRRVGFTCVSRVTGVTCRNGRGHGLFISRESWRAW